MTEEITDVYEFSENPADAKPPELLNAGEYRATVRGSKLVKSNAGNTMIEIDYIIDPSQYPADAADLPADGVTGKGYIVITDDATGRFRYKQACEKHGVTPTKRVDANAFMGQDTMVKISSETFEGVPRYKPFNAQRPA